MRIIKLKSKRLRRIRLELRMMLLFAWRQENIRIRKEMNTIIEHGDPYYRRYLRESGFSEEDLEYGDLSHGERLQKIARLYKEQMKLDDLLFHSVCACRWCGDFEADLIYNPIMKAWYCESCYLKRQEKHPNLFPALQ